MLLYTAHALYSGPDKLDISVQGDDKIGRIFTPTDIIEHDKNQLRLSFEQYIFLYNGLMQQSYKKYKNIWENILHREQLVITCYCKDQTKCHRSLLAKIFIEKGINVVYKGETK